MRSDASNAWNASAGRGKVVRAEPVAVLYQQGRVHHIGTFPQLEDQMTNFTSDIDRAAAGYSPDRVDALVWAFSELLVEPMKSEGIFELYAETQKPPSSAINRNPPKPHRRSAPWNGKLSRRNRAEPLPLLRRQERRAAPTSSQVTGGPMVRIHLPPAVSHTNPIIANSAGSGNARNRRGPVAAKRRRRESSHPAPELSMKQPP
jgi:hypothetical protein